MDTSRLRTGEIVAALGGLALFIFLFVDWYGLDVDIDEDSGAVPDFPGASGWESFGGDVTGFIVFFAAITAITLGALALAGRRRPMLGAPWGGPTAVLGVLAFDIVLWKILSVPEGLDLEFGIFLGLASAAAIAVGGYLTLAEGGIDPLGVRAAGGSGTATASSSTAGAAARPATPTGGGTTTTRQAGAAGGRKTAAKKRAAKKSAAKKGAAKKRAASR